MRDALGHGDVQEALAWLGHAHCACREGTDAMPKHRDDRLLVPNWKKTRAQRQQYLYTN
jgi:hypothetical protein